MGTINVSLPSDGTTADVADYNTPITTIVDEFNGGISDDNIASGAAIATSKLAADNGITAGMIGNSAITLGYAQKTSDQTGIGGSPTQVTGLSTTVTIPSGSRKIKITAFARSIAAIGGAGYMHWQIWDGTVGSGTLLADGQPYGSASGDTSTGLTIAVVTPSAGSKTYNVGAYITANTLTVEAAATYPAFILVEAI